ncbi:hypothetical protein MTP99_015889 [Tenebrio molitor]|jgi:hypothetical protein|uniref:Microtubule-associated protein Jupiter n=1 Tax=Tenebrio molitor TaxID=7067 RepID=A0A8J6LEQ0_TENMO|nr:hypothetical protein GEV33_002597 [Tenebrio molitor]KAJ3628590.1 hypothetical protein MTP99_015889 [Tenebrio molitor]CAH1374562.1 unnamed protein product [Tenebrio molitor]
MGDTDAPTTENPPESQENATCDITKPSIDILKEAKPSENIAITDPIEKTENTPLINVETTVKASTVDDTAVQKDSPKNVEELPKDKLCDILPKTIDELKNDNKPIAQSVKDEIDDAIKQKEKASLKNRSDIFSLNENKNLPSTIFSVGGAPSKTIHMTTNTNSSKTSSSNDTIGLAGSKQNQFRNPVTGIGVSSNDEFKNKPSKRKDGNPLLGVGYKDDEEFFNAPTSQRIPPGGYSKGLW